jgi:hypothetical protein
LHPLAELEPRPGVVHESSGASLECEGLASLAVADAPATSGNAGSPPACAQGARNQLLGRTGLASGTHLRRRAPPREIWRDADPVTGAFRATQPH